MLDQDEIARIAILEKKLESPPVILPPGERWHYRHFTLGKTYLNTAETAAELHDRVRDIADDFLAECPYLERVHLARVRKAAHIVSQWSAASFREYCAQIVAGKTVGLYKDAHMNNALRAAMYCIRFPSEVQNRKQILKRFLMIAHVMETHCALDETAWNWHDLIERKAVPYTAFVVGDHSFATDYERVAKTFRDIRRAPLGNHLTVEEAVRHAAS